jgi:hypothetical protein
MNLTPDQLDQFKNLLVEKQMVAFDSISAASEQGIDPYTDFKGFFQVIAGAEKSVDGQMATLLGDTWYNQFIDYQKTIPARNTINLLSQALSFTSAPLSGDQASRLVQTLTETGAPALPPNNPFAVLNSDLGVVKLSDQGRLQLQEILTPAQLRVLDEKIQQQAQLLEVRSRMGRPGK